MDEKQLKSWAKEREVLYFTPWIEPLKSEWIVESLPISKLHFNRLENEIGYTIWDSSRSFEIGETKWGPTLFFPSLLFSKKGEVLDYRTPLLRSEEKLAQAASRLGFLIKPEYKIEDKRCLWNISELNGIWNAALIRAQNEHAALIQTKKINGAIELSLFPAHPSFSFTVMNTIFADSLALLIDEGHATSFHQVRYGDEFSSLGQLLAKKTVVAFQGVLTEAELEIFYWVFIQNYVRKWIGSKLPPKKPTFIPPQVLG